MSDVEALTFQAQPANTVLAGPTSGGNGAPDFRALIDADTPSVAPVPLTDGATITWATGGAKRNNATVTIAGARTLAITGAIAGAEGRLLVTQGSGGTHTLALPSPSKVAGGAATLSTTAGTVDRLSWYFDGTTYWWAAPELAFA